MRVECPFLLSFDLPNYNVVSVLIYGWNRYGAQVEHYSPWNLILHWLGFEKFEPRPFSWQFSRSYLSPDYHAVHPLMNTLKLQQTWVLKGEIEMSDIMPTKLYLLSGVMPHWLRFTVRQRMCKIASLTAINRFHFQDIAEKTLSASLHYFKSIS